jgi:hypothetical protein
MSRAAAAASLRALQNDIRRAVRASLAIAGAARASPRPAASTASAIEPLWRGGLPPLAAPAAAPGAARAPRTAAPRPLVL